MSQEMIEDTSDTECCAVEALLGIVLLGGFLAFVGGSAYLFLNTTAQVLSRTGY